jgi:hypothetical protein
VTGAPTEADCDDGKARRRWWCSGGAPRGPRELNGGCSLTGDGSWPPGHTHRRPRRSRHRWPHATMTRRGWEGMLRARHHGAKLLVVLMGSEDGRDNGNNSGCRSPARLGNGVAALCARVRREWEWGGEASEEKEGARAGHFGAPPRRGRHGHMAERRTCGVHGEDALAHGRHALPKGIIRRARGRRLSACLGG